MSSGRFLLDTHTVLWAFYAPKALSPTAREVILNAEELFISIITPWEIAMKFSRGGFGDLPVPKDWEKSLIPELEKQGYRMLPVDVHHCRIAQDLPFHHKDPFDRMLIAQAIAERLDLLSRDEKLAKYEVKRVW